LPSENPKALLRLVDPGLQVEHLHAAIRAGEGERRTAVRDDPLGAGGSRDYQLRVRTLRQILRKELGWKRYEFNGLPLVINQAKTVAIGVAKGDAATGNPDVEPRTERPVGEIKRLLVAQNQQQLGLFDLDPGPDEIVLSDEELARLQTWFLLTRRRARNDTVIIGSELSHAIDLDWKGHIWKWKPRICLPDLEFEGVIDYIEGTDDGPEEYDVPVGDH
jgi:hypothetical protein